MVRLPFTRSFVATRLSTRPSLVARFSEPEGVLSTSAIRRCTGTDANSTVSSFCEEEVTTLSPPSPSSAPSLAREDGNGLTSRAARASEETVLRDRTDSSRRFARRLGGRSPSSNPYRAPHSSCEHCYERRNLSRVLLAPGDSLHANVGRTTAEASGSRISPRRAVRSDEDRGAFHRPALVRTRGSLPLIIRAGLPSTQHLCPEEHRRFAA